MTPLSTAAFYERGTDQLGALRQQAERLQAQVSTGDRLERSSDDPVAAARLRELSREGRLSQVDARNADRASSDLSRVDNALLSVSQVVIRARELALQAANETISDDERALIATEVESLGAQLFTLANSPDGAGAALFGGEGIGAAYAQGAGGVTYDGGTAAPLIDLGNGQIVARSLTGPEIFDFTHNGANTDLFAALGALSSSLAAGGAGAIAAAGDALGALDAGLDKITTAQTVTGSRLGFIEAVSDRRVLGNELAAEEQADLGGVDLASAITRLQETLTVLEASQASFVRLSSMSLFDVLR